MGQLCPACIYFGEDVDPAQFREVEREALMFRSRQDPSIVNLIIKSSLEGDLPKDMAWVLPFPSMPEVKEADPEVFNELMSYFTPKSIGWESKEVDGVRAASLPGSTIEVHEARLVGNHEIVPIEIKETEGAGEEMNAWLRSNGYIELPREIQKPYLKKGAVFLAIKVRPEGNVMDLKPLWISYKSSRMEFPLRFTHDYRTFDLNLYLIHDTKPEEGRGLHDTLGAVLGGPSGLISLLAKNTSSNVPRPTSWEGFPPDSISEFRPVWDAEEGMAAFRKYSKIAKGSQLEKISIHGVNTSFRTRDLKMDPGI